MVRFPDQEDEILPSMAWTRHLRASPGRGAELFHYELVAPRRCGEQASLAKSGSSKRTARDLQSHAAHMKLEMLVLITTRRL